MAPALALCGYRGAFESVIAYEASLSPRGTPFDSGISGANRLLDLPQPPSPLRLTTTCRRRHPCSRERGLAFRGSVLCGFDDTLSRPIYPP